VRILAVEDDLEFRDALVAAFDPDNSGIAIVFAGNRDEALAAVRDSRAGWGLVICDLRIPAEAGTSPEVEHGMAVYGTVVAELPGTPLRILSAFGTFALASTVMSDARKDDAFGEGFDKPMIRSYEKYQLVELAAEVREMAEAVAALDGIEVATGPEHLELSDPELRVIRVHARRQAGAVARLAPLAGGLSASTTIRVLVEDERGARTSTVVAKLGSIERVSDERGRFNRHIAPSLGATAFAPMAGFVTAGAGRTGGLFYSVAEPSTPLFGVLRDDPDRARRVVGQLEAALAPWRTGVPASSTRVGDIRRDLVPDEQLASLTSYLGGIAWQEAEDRTIQARGCTVHGDLHGANVLVLPNDMPILIDYGRTGRTSVAIDPMMLELSLLLHPAGRAVAGAWPNAGQAEHWIDLDDYVRGFPGEPFVRACREWAHRVAAGDREVFAVGYAYAFRQLLFDRTDRDLAVAVLRGAVARLLS
jgi:CheY-like chemotaxis protein